MIYQKTAIRINRTQLQLHFLNQTFLDSASSSLVVPYAYPSASVSDAILNKVAHPAILSALSSDEAVLVRQHDSNRTKSELARLKETYVCRTISRTTVPFSPTVRPTSSSSRSPAVMVRTAVPTILSHRVQFAYAFFVIVCSLLDR
jgi:hypothetical protein